MFDVYDPGELIGPAFNTAPRYFRYQDPVRIAHGQYAAQLGHVVREGHGPHPQGPLDYPWYEVVLTSGVRLYVAGWGWLLAVES